MGRVLVKTHTGAASPEGECNDRPGALTTQTSAPRVSHFSGGPCRPPTSGRQL